MCIACDQFVTAPKACILLLECFFLFLKKHVYISYNIANLLKPVQSCAISIAVMSLLHPRIYTKRLRFSSPPQASAIVCFQHVNKRHVSTHSHPPASAQFSPYWISNAMLCKQWCDWLLSGCAICCLRPHNRHFKDQNCPTFSKSKVKYQMEVW